MAIAAARTIRNEDIVFCGTGISLLAAMAAKHISAPESIIFFETGAIDSRLSELPLAVGDPRVMDRTAVNGSLLDAFATMQNPTTGRRVVGILGAAQIDPYGNLNSTVIGDYAAPRVRFSGSGGACDVASFVDRTIIFMQHEKRKFVSKVDYLTSPGWLAGGHSRRDHGLAQGGPQLVITNLAVMGFDGEDHRMFLKSCYPGVTVADVVANTGFTIDVTRHEPMAPPSAKELRVLREVCDPQRLILG
jgi:glutaconate CoA-transferase subunit B